MIWLLILAAAVLLMTKKTWNGTLASSIDRFALAISIAEGFYPGTLGWNNNNPGNLVDPKTGRFRVFATAEEGWIALKQQLQFIANESSRYYNLSMTLTEMASIYAQDNSGAWASNVALVLGVSPSTTLGEILNNGMASAG